MGRVARGCLVVVLLRGGLRRAVLALRCAGRLQLIPEQINVYLVAGFGAVGHVYLDGLPRVQHHVQRLARLHVLGDHQRNRLVLLFSWAYRRGRVCAACAQGRGRYGRVCVLLSPKPR